MNYKTLIREVLAYANKAVVPGTEYEFEARFSQFDRSSFDVLRQKLKQMSNNPAKKEWKPFRESEYTDFIIEGRRYSTIPGKENLKIIRKIGILAHKTKGIKYSLAQERDEGLSEDVIFVDNELTFVGPVREIELRRKKFRTSFEVQDITIDMTEVIQNKGIKYEVEVETTPLNLKKNIKLFEQLIKIIEKLAPSNHEMIKFFNTKMTQGVKNFDTELIYGTVARARDLKIEDITSNGIIKDYAVSVKADGEYKFLIFHSSGVWLVYPKMDIMRLGDISDNMPQDTIIAGELIKKENMKTNNMVLDSEYIYVPFDITVNDGDATMNRSYADRIEILKSVLKENTYLKVGGVNKIFIMNKMYYKITSVETFYSSMNKVMKERLNVPYKEDGIMITPIRSGYTPSGLSRPFRERVLDRYTDICKWKPEKMLTIDFLYEFNGEHIIKTKSGDIVDLKSFDLYKKFKFIDLEKLKTRSGSIVEFKPIEKQEDIVVLKPERIREDKIFPNDFYLVDNLYGLIMNPITERTLLGENTTLMRKFHNKIKRNIFNSVPNGSILIDIGSGKGGDITKWSKFSSVLAVEPNQIYVKELERRLREYKQEDKVEILNTHGEDTDSIISALKDFLPEDLEGKKVFISFMFSLSFFWESETRLGALAKTINYINKIVEKRDGDKCELLFVTLDGKRLNTIFDKYNNSKTTDYRNVDLNTISMYNKRGNTELKISIDDSKTVKESQIEYFVYMEQLFEKINYKYLSKMFADSEAEKLILSDSELIYSSAVIYGMATASYEKIAQTPSNRLPVSTTSGIEQNGKIFMKGDDEFEFMPHIGKGIYRVATIDNGISIVHSVLKLISKEYLDEDANKRHERANDFVRKVNYKISPRNIAKVTNYSINIINYSNIDRIQSGPRSIFLYINRDGTYEPLVKKLKNGEFCSTFE